MIVICGGFLSTLLGPIGPAAAQLPATSHSWRVPVKAAAVSVPAGTLVVSVKFAGEFALSPEPLSLAVQAMLTSLALHKPSGETQMIAGGVVSTVGGVGVTTWLRTS